MNNKTINYYNKYTKSFIQTTRSVDFTNIQNKFLSYLPSGASILDFGCGAGRDTKYFLKRNYNVTAIDGSEEICKGASKYTGIKVKQMLFEELNDQNIYDGIWACAILGHFPPQEVKPAMEKILKALKEDGILYFSVRKGDRNGRYNGRYFYDYDREALNDLLDSFSNIKVLDIWKTSDVRTDKDNRWFNVLLRKEKQD